ncbi:MAG: DoxX family protein [Alistipes sp.]|jgi:uncharacterized membrane protein YphA (DoxX/SURF4 family)|nr:DoxX family protein [Alistipes sp.]
MKTNPFHFSPSSFNWATASRLLLGLTFIFSGFVKTIDPLGTALKITEYLNVYGFGALTDLRIPLSIAFCAAELIVGLMLVFGVKTRLVSIVALLVMSFFSVVTLLSATLLPVEDCGCFGDALKMSPWASFGKNVVLWALALIVWRDARRRKLNILPVTPRELTATLLFACMAVGLGIQCYRHLPLIDFLPYKKGVNLRAATQGEGGAAEEMRMIYRDLRDGSLREFAVSDTTWYDSSRWEFVESVESPATTPASDQPAMSLREFALFNAAGDATRDIVDFDGRVYMLCASRLDLVTPACAERFASVATRAAQEGARIVLLTSTPLSGAETVTFAGHPVEAYNIDATTMITMLRAPTGIVVLENGVIVDKKNIRDLKVES